MNIFLLSMPSGGEWLSVIFLLLIPYFIPTIIAVARKKQNAASIAVLNIFLGWTLIGWVVSLIWAVAKDNQQQNIIVNQLQSSTPQPVKNEEGPVQFSKSHQDKIAQLQQIKGLLDSGVLTQDEFEQQKKKVLAM